MFIATDYFDASINRIFAWVSGVRNVQKALLYALLEPTKMLKELQDKNDFTSVMYISEQLKTMPFGDGWNEFLARNGLENEYLEEIKKYEREVLINR